MNPRMTVIKIILHSFIHYRTNYSPFFYPLPRLKIGGELSGAIVQGVSCLTIQFILYDFLESQFKKYGSRAESKNWEIPLFPTADRRFDTKVKCPTRQTSFWVKFSFAESLTHVKCPGIAGGGGAGGNGWFWN